MAIVNTFEKCLDSPYLRRDAAAPGRVAALLAQGEDLLGAARDLLGSAKPDPTDVGTLAYQAMFAGLRALVYARGYREAGLKCLVLACEVLYVRRGRLDAAQLVAFERVQGFKLGPAEAVATAGSFLQLARALAQEPDPAPTPAPGGRP